ncbi:MAG TPA: trehalase family glycosidase [Chthoniobacterales bacterium]
MKTLSKPPGVISADASLTTGDAPNHSTLLRDRLCADYRGMFRPAGNALPHPFLTPGSEQYADVLWDWDSWLSNVALRQILLDANEPERIVEAEPFEKGCVLNFLEVARRRPDPDGWVPIQIPRSGFVAPKDIYGQNMHKPCLAQHAAFLVRECGDAEWLRDYAYPLQCFINNYRNHHRHECGLYFWQDDRAIGVDNDPCTFGRPARSSGSIFLNCLMYRELLALAWVLERLGLDAVAAHYQADAASVREAVQAFCWDERDGFFYSVDLNLNPVRRGTWEGHSGQTRDWPCLIQRIGVWSGFMALWAGIATPAQAERVAAEHYRNPETFGANYGVRTLSRMEKMYNLRASGNPSSWLGPVWGISNYLTFRGFLRYDLLEDGRDLAEKTISLFGRDLRRFGALHEYYQPDNGEPILNRGFQNWNYLVLNMTAWLEGRPHVEEF